ncbi:MULTISPECIES: hypothetical protein [unclassified Chryseobacterium]|uniref:hypothetical protein n=1 Tax=unclassified Chryseobacterium TaxID=2593645 RepID=UPI00100AFB76|nr:MULTISPECIES: hypothetical protein [unclassified Chryseobacterium]RXM51728.1 hypothetical protein BOQ64_12515 [Chryseobacterium sp. CH25]RXM67306.1 hypothetical protein BOQ60_05240 [Chryseobacterium sp. CH1]
MKKLTKHPKKRLGFRNKKNITVRASYSQLFALFYIRNANITLERDAKEILRMLKELQQLINRSRLVFSTYCSLSQHNLWQSVLEDLSENIKNIRIQFEYILGNIIKKNKINSLIFWQQNKLYTDEMEVTHKKLILLTTQILPEKERSSWKTNIYNFYEEIFSLLIPLIGMCRLELDFIAKHSPKIFSQSAMDDIPKNYTLQEAKEYEHEYLKVLTNHSHEFCRKNNFWNSLLYILSGGMYSLPSERKLSKKRINRKIKDKFS